jgi:uncharacterized iron-regulated membrane protein
MFRKILFWSHLAVGLTAGVIILLMSVTGVLLMYEKQIIAYVDRTAQPPANAPAMPVEALLAALPGASNVTMRSGTGEPWTVVMGRETVLVDPANGRVLGPQTPGVRAFFRLVTDWHRWLGAGAANRAGPRAITGASNLLFLFLVVSGLYLWLPRKWAWPSVRAVLWFRGGLAGKARDFNWHNVAGFWCCVPLFFVVLSGVVISYPWASDLVYQASGVAPPPRGKGKGGPPAPVAARSIEGLDGVAARAKESAPHWQSMTFAVPANAAAPVTFNVDEGNGGQPQKRWTLTLQRSGEVLSSSAFQDQNAGQRARSWMRFVHTGEYYGWLGQTVAGIASAGGALLVWTGFALAYRRYRAWKAR